MKLLKVLRPHFGLCGVAVGTTLFSVIASVLLRKYLGSLLDRIAVEPIQWVTTLAILCIGIFLFVVLSYGKAWSISRLLHNIKAQFYQSTASFLLYQYSNDFSLGELSSLLSNDVNIVANSINRIFTKLLSDTFFFLCSLGVIFFISPSLALIVLFAATIPAFLITFFSKRQQLQRQEYMKELAVINEKASQGLFSLESVKANVLEENYTNHYLRSLKQLWHSCRRLEKTQAMLTAPSVFSAFSMQIILF